MTPEAALIVLDFDGTIVQADADMDRVGREMAAGLGRWLGRDVAAEWARWAAAVDADPVRYGWRHRGVVTAAADGDPYLRVSCIARALCDALGQPADARQRARGIEAIFRACYAQSCVSPRPEALSVLRALREREPRLWVVTNSQAEAVSRALASLDADLLDAVQIAGNARKLLYHPAPRDPHYDALEPLAVPGLEGREVVVKRGHYYDALQTCWRAAGCGPAQMLVCGDSFELDLALPLALGARVHLLRCGHTSPHTAAWLAQHPRGSVSADLWGLLEACA